MSSHKIYLGVPTDGKPARDYAEFLSTQIHVVFGLAFKGAKVKEVTTRQLDALIAVNRLQDELYKIAFPPRRRGKRK